jgi:HK97 family phage portal protein
MGYFQNLAKKISERATAKSYIGIMGDALPKASSQAWGGSEFLDAMEVSLYTNRAISKRADKVGEIEFLLRDEKGNTIERDALLDLLYKPNSVFTGPQFWGLYQKYYDGVGEVYIYVERATEFGEGKKVKALHLLNPTNVTPHFTSTGEIEKYTYKTGAKDVEYTKDDVLYVHNPDPKNPLRGVSLLKAGMSAIQTETQIATYHSRVLANGGKVEGVFKFKTGTLTQTQLEEIKDKYKKEYAGAKKAGIPLFLGGDADYVKLGLTPEELSFLEAKRMTLDDICILTGVPKSLLASTTDVKFDNADADRAIFLRETIRPLLVTLTTLLDERLFPDNRTLTFVDPTPENIDAKLKETESGIRNFYMTINEARARHGLDPVDNGDDIMVPFSLSPLGSTPEAVGEEATKSARRLHPLRDADMRKSYGKVQSKRGEAHERTFKRNLRVYLKEQEARVLENLGNAKNLKTFTKNVDNALNIELEVMIGKKAFLPVLTALVKQAGIDAMEIGGSERDFNVSTNIASWIESRAGIFLRSINTTTHKQLKDAFADSMNAEDGREGLINRIQDIYKDASKQRAALIARTEVHNSMQYGTVEGYRQSGLTTKIWVAVMDDATRDSHADVDGEEKPIDMVFSNGLMYPGDSSAPAEEVINCRCVV